MHDTGIRPALTPELLEAVMREASHAAPLEEVAYEDFPPLIQAIGRALGFTWEDVDLLRQAAADACAVLEVNGYPDDPTYQEWGIDEAATEAHPLSKLADRIAALLPPRP